MKGNTIAERQKRREEIKAQKENPSMEYDAKRVTIWLDNNSTEAEWMKEEIKRSNLPGHQPWDYIKERNEDGAATARVGLAMVG